MVAAGSCLGWLVRVTEGYCLVVRCLKQKVIELECRRSQRAYSIAIHQKHQLGRVDKNWQKRGGVLDGTMRRFSHGLPKTAALVRVTCTTP